MSLRLVVEAFSNRSKLIGSEVDGDGLVSPSFVCSPSAGDAFVKNGELARREKPCRCDSNDGQMKRVERTGRVRCRSGSRSEERRVGKEC